MLRPGSPFSLGIALLLPGVAWAGAGDGGDDAATTLIGALVVVGLLVWTLLGSRKRRAVNLPGGAPGAASVRGASRWSKRRQARRLRAAGQAIPAGELFLELGDKEAALEVYVQAGLMAKAGPIFEERGELQAAVQAYETGRDFERAAKVAVRLGDQARAAANFERAGSWEQAAKYWQVLSDPLRAGNAWWRSGNHEKAAQTYQAGGLYEEAGRAYRFLLSRALGAAQSGPVMSGDVPKIPPEARDLALRAGRTLVAAGNLAGAAEAFLAGGCREDAAQTLAQSGDFDRAARLMLEAGDFPRSADLFTRAGNDQQADAIRARVALSAGRNEEAAVLLERSGDHANAARLWVQLGSPERAATLLEKTEDWFSAASLWERAGQLGRAAAAFERIGDARRAAELYQRAGDRENEARVRKDKGELLRVAELRMEAGDAKGAEEVLKQVRESSPAYRKACRVLGDLYRKRGDAASATVKYRQALHGLKPDARTVDVFYSLGQAALQADEAEVAVAAFRAIREFDPTYKDVRDRLGAALGRGVAKEPPKPASRSALETPHPMSLSKRYERFERLGKGGMGNVYRARDTLLGREVALKVLAPADNDPKTAQKRFLREARSAAALNHPNIVTVFDFGEQEGELYIAMELVEGSTLRELVKGGGPLGLPLLRAVMLQSCEALAYAHAQGVIHRDIKPANLMWTRGRVLKITDFGLAKILEREGSTLMSRVLGTPYYMSPEQIRGRAIDPRTDLYSFGVSLYELTTAQLPFSKGNVFQAHLKQKPSSPTEHRGDIPDWLERIILRCLEKNPDRRYQDVKELRSEIPG